MYKKENEINNFSQNKFIHLNTVDYYYYDSLYNINKLFKNYKSKIGSKSDPNSVNQTIIYYNPDNITEKFTIQINNKYSITTTVPLMI